MNLNDAYWIVNRQRPKSSNVDFFVSVLNEISGIHITLIENKFSEATNFSLRRKFREYGPILFLSKAVFSFLFGGSAQKQNSISSTKYFSSNWDRIELSPIVSSRNAFYQYLDDDIAKLIDQSLDLIVRGDGRGILRGDILNASKFGIVSIHYGDNRVIRGGPPGFWEVYFGIPATGYTIQVLADELDAGGVLARGQCDTRMTYKANQREIIQKANTHLSQIIKSFCQTG